MSNIMYSIFSNKKVNLSKLLQFGFVQTESGYIYRKTLSESGFLLNVHVTPQGEISTEIIDPSLNELYTLHLVGHATGGFVWKKFPKNAIWRRKDTQKWYGILLTVSKQKLGLLEDEPAEIFDFRMLPEELEALVDYKMYFPGYHMNKKHWCTIILDGSVPFKEICRRIDASYLLATQ